MDKKIIGIATVLLAVLAISSITPMSVPSISDSTKAKGTVCLDFELHSGKYTVCAKPNTVTNIAKNQTREVRMGKNNSQTDYSWDYIQLSTGATGPAATDTICEATRVTSNGLDIAQGTVTEAWEQVGNFTVTKKFEATGSQAGIVKVCLHNGSAATGELMASSAVTSFDLTANENVTIRYSVAET